MKQELAWGAAAAVALVAAVGISSPSGSKPAASTSAGHVAAKGAVKTKPATGVQPECADSISLIEHFFLHSSIAAPNVCYAAPNKPATADPDSEFQPTFVIATFPDPLHTHFSLLFDRFVEAIQEGAQDEGYEYDSSWLPWETEEPSFGSLKDQDDSDDRKTKREDQPGILLFRNAGDAPYKKALIVFVVGEEPTRGIHRVQFENAVAWIHALQSHGTEDSPVAILGPTFSGSLSSLNALIATDNLASLNKGRLAIYTGSASSRDDGTQFAMKMRESGADFRSFLQDDQTVLSLFCRYMGQASMGESGNGRSNEGGLANIAILSEDETAYGNIVAKSDNGSIDNVCRGAINLYYPRDISTLRAAYQNQSMFSSATAQQNQDNAQRKSLPTDLVDPGGEQHDTVRTYAGNQTPLSQEAQLLGIVEALRAHRAQYVVLRSSNTLDPLFLANFLRRDYPEARLVVDNSDLLFQRGQDAMALNGVMTLSTYPLFSRARDWTALHRNDEHSHRVFPENSTEGTYIASRLLLQSLARAEGKKPTLNCKFSDQEVFAPPLRCEPDGAKQYAPLPDYSPPYLTDSQPCNPDTPGQRCRPAAWLSVITRNGTWPLAALTDRTLEKANSAEHPKWPAAPRSTEILLIALCGFVLFHAMCCGFASFTAKPAFRAHFASGGQRHAWLVLIGSTLIALMALLTGWGCGLFSKPSPLPSGFAVWAVVVLVCVVAGGGMVANLFVTKKLGGDAGERDLAPASTALRVSFSLAVFVLLLSAFFWTWVGPIEAALLPATRAFVYWRSMHLTSGVSPIVPFLSMTMGLYLWFWYALHGLALFGPDRPCLPPMAKLGIKLRGVPEQEGLKLAMFSQEKAATPVECIAMPLAWDNVKLMLVLFAGFALLVACVAREVPVRSLGARTYALIYCFWLDFYFSVILVETWQIWRTWSGTRQLLVFLDRLALRRTLSALQGFSWGSVWKMSGNVLDVRYKLLSRQLECLNHLHTSLRVCPFPASDIEKEAFAAGDVCLGSVDASRKAGMEFAKWYSQNYDNAKAAGLEGFRKFQKQVAETTGVVLTELLLPVTRLEQHSLIQADPDAKSDDDRRLGPASSQNELVRNAEELVCLTYLGFAQNLLGRIRTIVLGGMYLFVAATIAVSSYPFDPRPLLSGVLLLLFVAFGAVVVFVYADMHRDATLSHVTNTNPGELGSEFWFKVVGYGAAPVLGLITQIFPEWSGFLFSWLQPGLSSLK